MRTHRFLALIVLTILPAFLIAQDGKLRGKVMDRYTQEALIGANIIIEGTSLGASSDLTGDYIILGVPPGIYTIKVSYIGYATYSISNVRVNSNVTTSQDFQLSPTSIQVEAIEVVADRPLIQRNTTNTVRVTTQESVEFLPFRGLENILALEAGVVQQDGNLYVRGGRAGEVAYFVDGTNVTNPFLNTANVSVIQEAIEEIQLQSGGFTAEYGGANSAIVRTTLRSGGTQLRATIDYQTDDFAKPGSQFLGTSAFGFRNAVVTLGGPVPFLGAARFFVAGQHNYLRNRQPMYLEPFQFEGLTTDGFGGRSAGILLPNNGTIEFKRNHLYDNWSESNFIQGTVSYDFNPLKFRFSGSYLKGEEPRGGGWPSALVGYFNQKRNTVDETTTSFANMRITHVLGSSTFYEVGLSYNDRFHRRYDPEFGDEWSLYVDSTANAERGYTGFLRRYSGPLQWSTINGFRFNDPDSPNNSYVKDNQRSIGFHIDFVSQVNSGWELKAGGRLDSWVIRNYTMGNIEAAMVFLNGLYGTIPRSFSNEYERRIELEKAAGVNHYGYDVDGNEVDEGFDAPQKPLFTSAYVQNKFEFHDVILNLGLRYEFYDPKITVPPDPSAVTGFDHTLDYIDETSLTTKKPSSYILPRVSFSFPATDQTVFYAQFGKYVQLPQLSRLYAGNFVLSRNLSPFTRNPWGRAQGSPPAFMVVPERTTQYEMGLRQTLTDNFAFTVSGFYKHVKDQLQYNKYPSPDDPLFVAWKNDDFAVIKGLELTLELRRTNRMAARLNYTLSDARGTASDAFEWYAPVSDITINSRFPLFVNPLGFNQTHRGTILIDYRLSQGEGGPVFDGFGANFILSFNSGHNYTKILNSFGAAASPWLVGIQSESRRKPTEPINSSSTPWNFNVDLNLNKRISFESFAAEVYVNVLNLFDTKQILNVYETTGTPEDDGWLSSPQSKSFRDIGQYSEFYEAINLENRWAYISRKGTDLYGSPRQVRVGIKVEINP
ncbi:MAG: TonB-dependent receptor [Bacteroidota bacterium]